MIEECIGECFKRTEVLDGCRGEIQIFEVLQNVFETASNEIVPRRRQASNEQIKNGGFGHPGIEVSLEHGQLVEVGQQGDIFAIDIRHASVYQPVSRREKSGSDG